MDRDVASRTVKAPGKALKSSIFEILDIYIPILLKQWLEIWNVINSLLKTNEAAFVS